MTESTLYRYFLSALNSHQDTFSQLEEIQPFIVEAGKACAHALRNGNKIMLCGNGGSAADAQHTAAELTGRFVNDRSALAGLALTTDTSALTCIGNDYGFSQIFSRQVEGLGKAGDVLIGISTSGNSENIISAVISAKKIGITTIALLGGTGGKLRDVSDMSIIVPSSTTARIQEAHIFICHTLCGLIENINNL